MSANEVHPVRFALTGCLLSKSGGIAAPSAEFFRCAPGLKSVVYGFCPGCFQNLLKIFFKQIAQGNIALVVKTAGDNRSVAQDADMVLHSITEYFVRV